MDKLSLKEVQDFQKSVQTNFPDFSKQTRKQDGADRRCRQKDDDCEAQRRQEGVEVKRKEVCNITDLLGDQKCDISCRYVELFWKHVRENY